MNKNYTDEATGITYYGIAVYKDLNNIIGQTETYPDPDKCLSKDAADEIDTITYTDNDPDGGKLLRYDSIKKKINTIDIYIKNNCNYSIYVQRSNITFTFIDYDTNEQKEYTIYADEAYGLLAPTFTKKYTIINYRNNIRTNISTGLQLGKVTVSFKIKKVTAATLLCQITNSENNNQYAAYRSNTVQQEHTVTCTLENTSKVVPGPKYEYDTTTLKDYWPKGATSITFGIT